MSGDLGNSIRINLPSTHPQCCWPLIMMIGLCHCTHWSYWRLVSLSLPENLGRFMCNVRMIPFYHVAHHSSSINKLVGGSRCIMYYCLFIFCLCNHILDFLQWSHYHHYLPLKVSLSIINVLLMQMKGHCLISRHWKFMNYTSSSVSCLLNCWNL